jgi:hypothetical protein
MYKTNIAHMQVEKSTILDSNNEDFTLKVSGLKANKVQHENNLVQMYKMFQHHFIHTRKFKHRKRVVTDNWNI